MAKVIDIFTKEEIKPGIFVEGIVVKNQADELFAGLLVGPFKNEDDQERACRHLKEIVEKAIKKSGAFGPLDDTKPAPSPEEVLAARTGRHAWTKKTLAGWGVPWPPPKGWRKKLQKRYEKQNKG